MYIETAAVFYFRNTSAYQIDRLQIIYRSSTDHQQIIPTVHDLDISGQVDDLSLIDLHDLYDIAHVAEWELYNLHHLL